MNPNRLEPVLLLLVVLVVFFTILAVGCAWVFPQDGQTFQLIAGLLTSFSGALLLRVKPPRPGDHDPDIGTTVKTLDTTTVITSTTPEPKKDE